MLTTLADEVHERYKRTGWSQTDELLAELLELLSVVRLENLLAHGVKPRALPEPLHVPRPGERREASTRTLVLSPAEFAAMAAAEN